MTDARTLRLSLTDQLDVITDPAWLCAVAEVPREVFVGDRYYEDTVSLDGTSLWRPVSRAGQDDSAWLKAVYADETLVTQISGRYQEPADQAPLPGWPTSSSTLPSLVVRMLDDLQVADGMSVLEIGTGTGYSTGLLCHRLGDENVTSIEIDPAVATRASAALSRAGYHPRLITSDGLAGYQLGAPYDRIIATCSVRFIPWSWVAQLAAPDVTWTRLPSRADPGRADTILYNPCGSCAWLSQASDGTWTVAQSGPARIWDAIESTIDAYRVAGSPAQHEFRLTIRDGLQNVSHPNIDRTWDLPATTADGDVG